MDSSSEIEIMPTLKHPSPVKPRRTGRSRRVPRSVDEVAASAAPLARPVKRGRVSKGEDSEEDEMSASKSPQVDVDVKLLPKQQPPLPPLPAAPASKAKPVEVLTISSSASSTLASRSSEPTLPSKRQFPAPPPPSAPTPRAGSAPKPSSSNLAAGIKRPRSHTPGSGAAAPRKALPKKPVGGDSSDEADSFFQSKSTFKGRVPKAAGGGGGRQPGGGGRKPSAGPSSSAALTGSAKGKARYEFSTDSEVDQPKKKKAASISSSSSAATSDSALSNSDDSDSAAHKLSAKKKGIKHVNLPSWARGKTSAQAGMSGADKAALARGYKANRKRKDLKDSDGEKSEVDRLAAFMEEEEKEDTDDSLELEISTPNRKKPAVGAKKKKPNVADFSADDEPTPRAKLARPRPTASPARPPPRRREASTTSAAAGPSNPKPTPTKRNPDPRSHLSISSGSSSSDNNDDASLARSLQRKEYSKKSPRKAAAEEEEEEDDLATILANVRRLKEPVEASSARLSVDANGRSVSMGVARPTPSPAKSAAGRGLSSSPQKGAEEEGGVVDVSVRMVFDPTRTVAPMAKQVYEREEKFEVNVNDSFEDLFYSLSLTRSIPRDNLILTFLPPSSLSSSSRPTQVFEFGTPASLGLKAGEEAALRGYTKEVWEKVKKLEREKMERLQAQASVSERGNQLGGGGGGGVGAGGGGAAAVEEEDDDDELEAAAAAAAAAASQRPRSPSVGGAASPHDDDGGAGGGGGNGGPPPGLFPLTIRGSKTDSLSLAVRPTTTMAQLVKAYCKKFGGVAAKAWLEFDGDKLEGSTTVGEAKEEFDLEGEETFEIKGLS